MAGGGGRHRGRWRGGTAEPHLEGREGAGLGAQQCSPALGPAHTLPLRHKPGHLLLPYAPRLRGTGACITLLQSPSPKGIPPTSRVAGAGTSPCLWAAGGWVASPPACPAPCRRSHLPSRLQEGRNRFSCPKGLVGAPAMLPREPGPQESPGRARGQEELKLGRERGAGLEGCREQGDAHICPRA